MSQPGTATWLISDRAEAVVGVVRISFQTSSVVPETDSKLTTYTNRLIPTGQFEDRSIPVMAGLVPAISGQFRHAGDGGRASFFRAPGITREAPGVLRLISHRLTTRQRAGSRLQALPRCRLVVAHAPAAERAQCYVFSLSRP